jgi:hypothetical protein
MKNHNKIMCASGRWALAAAIGAVLAIGGCGGKAVVPTSYDPYNAKDGSFQIQYPAGWESDGGDRSGYAWAKFTSGRAVISVDADITGSLIGDISKSKALHLGIAVDQGEDSSPVAAVHEEEKQGFEEEEGVTEQKPVPVKTGFPDARKSEFSGSKTFGGAIRGCRVTALSPNKRVRVVCQCPESEWEALKPAFDKAIESVAMGKAQPF